MMVEKKEGQKSYRERYPGWEVSPLIYPPNPAFGKKRSCEMDDYDEKTKGA
jgi:hypothetical protein